MTPGVAGTRFLKQKNTGPEPNVSATTAQATGVTSEPVPGSSAATAAHTNVTTGPEPNASTTTAHAADPDSEPASRIIAIEFQLDQTF